MIFIYIFSFFYSLQNTVVVSSTVLLCWDQNYICECTVSSGVTIPGTDFRGKYSIAQDTVGALNSDLL